jgi:cytochrome c oxidase assembly protein subunit 15
VASETGSVRSLRATRRLPARLLSPGAFPGLVVATFVAIYVNVVSGALVRVTNSGLGCPDWPGCTAGRPVPASAGHQLIEFSNRVLALGVVVICVLCAVAGRRAAASRFHTRLALWIGGLTLAQIPLGGITVLFDLNPLLVMSHFLLAILDIGLATVLLVDVVGARPSSVSRPSWLPALTGAFVAWTFALVVSGAVVTMSGTHPGADNVRRLWNLLDAAYWHVRIGVSFVVVLALFLLAVSRLPATAARVPRLGWLVVACTGLQILVGEWQWRSALPWWLTLAHVTCATALWTSAVALGRSVVPRPSSG